MSVSKLLPSGGVNDFFITLSSTYTKAVFTKEYSSGDYTISSSIADLSYDIYAINSAGTLVGYTNSPALTATGGFNKIVILGQTTGNLLTFTYKTTHTSVNETDETSAGPVVASVSPTDVPNVDSTTVVTGRNFATNVEFYFSSGSYTSTIAKSVTRTSATSATITRPDTLPVGTYTITAVNPGINSPTGSNAHILANCITAGSAPSWSTSATLPLYTKNVAYSQTVVATDTSDPGSTLTYSQVGASTLPSGITFTATSAVIAGTATVTDTGSVTVRVTDSGGNFVDRVFTLANVGANAPVWGASPSLPISGAAYTYTCTATDDSGATPTFSLTGTLPTGLSFNSGTGVISGTTTDTTDRSITLRATDANGSYTDLVVSPFRAATLQTTTFTSSGTYTPISNTLNSVLLVGGGGGGGGTNNYSSGGSGGGGGGHVRELTSVAVTSGTAYSIVIGSGAAASNRSTGNGSIALNGNKTSAFGYEAFGGQGGMNSGNGWNQPLTSERGNGGGSASYGFGFSDLTNQVCDQGFKGNDVNNNSQGGGGGASSGAPGGSVLGKNGVAWSINGTTYGGSGAGGPGTYNGGTGGGGQSLSGGGSGTNATFYGGGGGGMSANNATSTNGGSGYQGIVLIYAYA
jgi:hypothetical protein